MRLTQPFVLITLLCCAVCAQDMRGTGKLSASMPLDSAQKTELLQLTASISDQKYCDDDHLKMTIRLSYKNIGRQPIILYKYSIAVPGYMVSRNVKTAEAKSYLKEVTPMIRPILPGPLDISLPDSDSVFVILKPGEVYLPEIETSVHLLNINYGTDTNNSFLHPGSYVIEIMVQTWYGSKELAATLNERWQQIGLLWTKPMKSQPMPFKIDEERKVVTCSD